MSIWKHHTHTPLKLVKKDAKYGAINKPSGLWLSYGDEWSEWCKNNNWGCPSAFIYTVDIDDSNMLKIDSYEKLTKFANEYKKTIFTDKLSGMALTILDWPSVEKKYDGIIVTDYENINDQYFNDTVSFVNTLLTWFLGLDVNCACVWNIDAVKEVRLSN